MSDNIVEAEGEWFGFLKTVEEAEVTQWNHRGRRWMVLQGGTILGITGASWILNVDAGAAVGAIVLSIPASIMYAKSRFSALGGSE